MIRLAKEKDPRSYQWLLVIRFYFPAIGILFEAGINYAHQSAQSTYLNR